MHITFKRVDKDYYGKNEYITPIVELAIQKDAFFVIVCEILNTFNKYTEHITNDVKKAMQIVEYKFKGSEADMKSYQLLETKVENFFWNIVDDNFGDELKKRDQDLYYEKKLAYADVRVARFRGLLFEELVTELVRTRFDSYEFCTGCQVYINNCRVMVYYGEGNAHHKETIDIAGWEKRSKYGEFYECKISPERFDEEHFRYLVELNQQLKSKGAKNFIVGFVSSDRAKHVEARRAYLKDTYGISNDDILLIGREDVWEIRNYTMPEIA